MGAKIWKWIRGLESLAIVPGETRDLVTPRPGAGWDYSFVRHPFYKHELPLGPHYCSYNRRLMVSYFDKRDIEDGYWTYRQKVGLLHTGEYVLQFNGADSEALLNKLLTREISKLKVGRCGYGLVCYEDGGLLVDGILLRLEPDLFWFVQADGDFYNWARAHSFGMDVRITDPDVFVSQVQGPNSLELLGAICTGGLPAGFSYYGIARVDIGGQSYIVTRTGYTNELGWEIYSEPHHDPDLLWEILQTHGAPLGLDMVPLDASDARRIEAGILNAGSDFDRTTTPFDVGLGRFVHLDKSTDFIGKSALAKAPRGRRLFGFSCLVGEPEVLGAVAIDGRKCGRVTAAAMSPFLKHGIGFALFDDAGRFEGDEVTVACRDGVMRPALLVDPPFYDKAAQIPRGKLVQIPIRS